MHPHNVLTSAKYFNRYPEAVTVLIYASKSENKQEHSTHINECMHPHYMLHVWLTYTFLIVWGQKKELRGSDEQATLLYISLMLHRVLHKKTGSSVVFGLFIYFVDIY